MKRQELDSWARRQLLAFGPCTQAQTDELSGYMPSPGEVTDDEVVRVARQRISALGRPLTDPELAGLVRELSLDAGLEADRQYVGLYVTRRCIDLDDPVLSDILRGDHSQSDQ